MSRSVTLKVAFGGGRSVQPRGASRPQTGGAGVDRENGGESVASCAGRVPRVARLMALAIRLDGLIRSGAVRNQAEAAELSHVTRARITQIMNLLFLAPDIQEAVLDLPLVTSGRDQMTEHELREVTSLVDWSAQRRAWRLLHR
jgi:hypothetical protein